MEKLLNKLIEKGWKPRGIPHLRNAYYTTKYVNFSKRTIFGLTFYEKSIRALVAKESGLWQFVCENNLNYSEDDSIYNVWLKHYAEDDHESPYTYASPVWYIIESALCDEDKLEEFLLSNIKVDD